MCFKSLIVACAIIALAPVAQARNAAGTDTNANPNAANMNQKMMRMTPDNLASMMYQGSQNEVKWSKMAQEMSQNQDVKQLAQMVAQDHQQMITSLQQLSKTAKINLNSMPAGAMGKDMKSLDDSMTNVMKSMPPHQFDNTFLTAMLMSHDMALNGIKHAQQMMQGGAAPAGLSKADEAKWTALQPLVQQAVPSLEKHRQRAYQLLGTLAPNVAAGGGTMGMNQGMGTQQPAGGTNQPTSNPENP